MDCQKELIRTICPFSPFPVGHSVKELYFVCLMMSTILYKHMFCAIAQRFLCILSKLFISQIASKPEIIELLLVFLCIHDLLLYCSLFLDLFVRPSHPRITDVQESARIEKDFRKWFYFYVSTSLLIQIH